MCCPPVGCEQQKLEHSCCFSKLRYHLNCRKHSVSLSLCNDSVTDFVKLVKLVLLYGHVFHPTVLMEHAEDKLQTWLHRPAAMGCFSIHLGLE